VRFVVPSGEGVELYMRCMVGVVGWFGGGREGGGKMRSGVGGEGVDGMWGARSVIRERKVVVVRSSTRGFASIRAGGRRSRCEATESRGLQ
jgi:hypothetical protein